MLWGRKKNKTKARHTNTHTFALRSFHFLLLCLTQRKWLSASLSLLNIYQLISFDNTQRRQVCFYVSWCLVCVAPAGGGIFAFWEHVYGWCGWDHWLLCCVVCATAGLKAVSGSGSGSGEVRETSNTVLGRLGYAHIDLNQWAVSVFFICVCIKGGSLVARSKKKMWVRLSQCECVPLCFSADENPDCRNESDVCTQAVDIAHIHACAQLSIEKWNTCMPRQGCSCSVCKPVAVCSHSVILFFLSQKWTLKRNLRNKLALLFKRCMLKEDLFAYTDKVVSKIWKV